MLSFCLLLLGYPIFDTTHLISFFIYNLVLFSFIKIEKSIIINSFISCFCIFMTLFFISLSFIDIEINKYYCNKSIIKDFENCYIHPYLENSLLNVYNYATEKYENVIFLGENAAIISINNNEYNGIFDLLLKGNLGTKKIENILDENKNIVYIINKNYLKNN